MKHPGLQLFIFIALLYSHIATAIEWEINHIIKYDLSTFSLPDNSPLLLTGDQQQTIQQLNYRGQFATTYKAFEFHADYQLNLLSSDNLSSVDFDNDQFSLFDLTTTVDEGSRHHLQQRLDRFYVGYQTDNSSYRFGRQAVTWGNGFIFNVMDIFNPFSPTALDREFKPGNDMLYAQHLSTSGDDWQYIYLPRRNSDGDIDNAQSSLVAKYHTLYADSDIDVLLAEHFDDSIFGLGISHALGESLWRLDMTHTALNSGQSITSLSTNLDYSWVSAGKNFYGFIEYYHNGFGIDDASDIATSYLLLRLERGELFTRFRNYLGIGLRIELHPLVNLSPTLISNLDDQSQLLSVNLVYDWQQNLIISTQLNIGAGSNNSEYNGPLSSGDSLSAQLAWYF